MRKPLNINIDDWFRLCHIRLSSPNNLRMGLLFLKMKKWCNKMNFQRPNPGTTPRDSPSKEMGAPLNQPGVQSTGIMPISAADVQASPLISESARNLMKEAFFGPKVTVFFPLPDSNSPFFTGSPKSLPSSLI